MNWECLTDGVEVLRFWKTVPTEGKEPQIAILRLSGEKYSDLHKAPKDFINGFKVFDKQVRSMTIVPASAAPRMTAQPTATTPQLVVAIHRPTCAAFAAAAVELAVAKAA